MKIKLKIAVINLLLIFTSIASLSFGQEVKTNNSIVAFKNITKYHEVKYMQQEYIRKNYDGYSIVSVLHSLPIDKNSPFVQKFILENEEGKKEQVCFDITAAYKARNKKGNQELKKLIENLEKVVPSNLSNLSNLSKEDIKKLGDSAEKLISEGLKKIGKPSSELTDQDRIDLMEPVNKLLTEKLYKK